MGKPFLILDVFDLADPPSQNFEVKERVQGVKFVSFLALEGFFSHLSDYHPKSVQYKPQLNR